MSRNFRIQFASAVTILAGLAYAKPVVAEEGGGSCYACVSSCAITQTQKAAECDEQCKTHGFSMPCSTTIFCFNQTEHIQCS